MECLECGSVEVQVLYTDCRNPPLDEEPCLCRDCRISALQQVIEDLEDARMAYQNELEELESYEDLE